MFSCHVCGHTAAKSEFVSEVFTIEGRRVLVELIPAEVCGRCGEATFSRETTESIRQLVSARRLEQVVNEARAGHREVEVMAFA